MGTFANSNYKRAYASTRGVEFFYELMDAVRKLLHTYALAANKSSTDADQLFRELNEAALQKSPLTDLLKDIDKVAVRLWTSTATAGLGREFCSILNHVIRSD